MCKYALQVHKEICERGWGFLSKVSSPFLRIRERAQKSKGGGFLRSFFLGGRGVLSGHFRGAPPPVLMYVPEGGCNFYSSEGGC